MALDSHQWGAHMKVEDLIHSRSEVYSVTEDMTVYDVARYLRERQVRAVGVSSPTASWRELFRKAIFLTRWRRKTSVRPGCGFRK